ncbi:MAG TPA: YoaK family protein [Frankiaceae bacterium]|nr:YoaK family protein [Frankiaceae bacterium]
MPQPSAPAERSRIVRYLQAAVTDERDGPLPAMMLSLTVLVGIVDATSILLAHVFVATITGNLVFLGLAISGAPGFSVRGSLLPIIAFAVGAVLGGRAFRAAGLHRGRAFRNVLGVKSALALAVTVLVITAHGHFDARTRDYIVILLAVSMGSQLAAIRFLAVRDLPTVVLTLVITGALVEANRGLKDPVMLRRVLAVLAFLIGIVTGGLLVRHVSVAAALSVGLVIVVGVTIAAHLVSRDDKAAWAIRS